MAGLPRYEASGDIQVEIIKKTYWLTSGPL